MFLFKSPNYTNYIPTKLDSNFKGSAQIMIDNAYTDGVFFELSSSAVGNLVIRDTLHMNDPGSNS